MKILAVADIHGRLSRLSLIEEYLDHYRPDALVIAGDMSRYGRPASFFDWLHARDLPVITLRGNTDPKGLDERMSVNQNIRPLRLEKIMLNGISFVGISGAIPVPFRTRVRFRQKEAFHSLRTLLGKDTVLIAHPPPLGTLDRVMHRFHAGCRPLRDVILECQPRLVICGHIHENPGRATVGRTTVVNCAMGNTEGGALIQLHKGKHVTVNFLMAERKP